MAMIQTIPRLPIKDNPDKINCLSLLNTALTCKDFLDVALDALWENLYTLEPLLKVLRDPQLSVTAA